MSQKLKRLHAELEKSGQAGRQTSEAALLFAIHTLVLCSRRKQINRTGSTVRLNVDCGEWAQPIFSSVFLEKRLLNQLSSPQIGHLIVKEVSETEDKASSELSCAAGGKGGGQLHWKAAWPPLRALTMDLPCDLAVALEVGAQEGGPHLHSKSHAYVSVAV